MAGPAPAAITAAVSEIHHPRLTPVTVDLSRPLGPDQVALLAVALQPAVRAARSQRALAHAQVIQAGLLPNPQLGLNKDFPLGAEDAIPALGVGLNWEVTSLVTYGAKKESANANADAIDLSVAWQEWQAAAGAQLAAVRWVSLAEQIAVAEENVSLQRAWADQLQAAVQAGAIVAADADQAQNYVADITAAVAAMKQQAESQRLLLNRVLGLPPATVVTLDVAAFQVERQPLPAQELQAQVEQRRLDLLGLRRGYDSEEAAVRSAILGQFPKVSVGLLRARDTSAVNTLGFGLTIDLPLFDRNQGVIASEEATRERLYQEYIDRVFQARADIAQATADLQAVAEQRVVLSKDEALLVERLSAQEDALTRGALAEGTVVVTHLTLLQKRQDHLRLNQQAREALIACALASGCYLSENNP